MWYFLIGLHISQEDYVYPNLKWLNINPKFILINISWLNIEENISKNEISIYNRIDECSYILYRKISGMLPQFKAVYYCIIDVSAHRWEDEMHKSYAILLICIYLNSRTYMETM